MQLSQKTLVRLMELIGQADKMITGDSQYTYWSRILYEYDFPDWFIEIAAPNLFFDWDRLIRELRKKSFFYGEDGYLVSPQDLSLEDVPEAAENFLEKLAAIAVIRIAPQYSLDSDQLIRSIENDGYTIDKDAVQLVPAEGHVSLAEEEGLLEKTIRQSGLSRPQESLKHLKDAGDELLDGSKDHSSLNESRSLFQSLVNQICEEVDRSGRPSIGLPSSMSGRLSYLETNGVWTNDQRNMFGAAWIFLSTGGHPGITQKEHARMGLLLSIEFCNVLISGWLYWKTRKP